jgi:enoyl reductase-like protein
MIYNRIKRKKGVFKVTKDEMKNEITDLDAELINCKRILEENPANEKTIKRIAKRETRRAELVELIGEKGKKYWNTFSQSYLTY